MLNAVIEVEFGPHWADEWMVWLTVGSIAVSGLLGWLAYWNGRKAGQIAKAASDRDESHRLEEARLREDRQRAEVALAMHAALNQVMVWAETFPARLTEDSTEEVKKVRELRVVALSKMDLYSKDDGADALRRWFSSAMTEISNLGLEGQVDLSKVYRSADRLRAEINRWRSGTPVSEIAQSRTRNR